MDCAVSLYDFQDDMVCEEIADAAEFSTLLLRDKRRENRARKIKEKKHLKELELYTGRVHHICVGDEKCWINNTVVALTKNSKFSKRGSKSAAHFLKKLCNRKVRHTAVPDGGGYKKASEYLWILT